MASIFISYRRSDSSGWAGRLHDSLQRLLPSSALFMDIEDIPPGVDFESFIGEAVSKCDLLIAIIGPHWIDARDEHGNRRLDLEGDFTRIEIESALTRKIRVIPVLVGGAKMPGTVELPESLRALAKRQNFELPDRGWDDGCKRLSKGIEQAVAPPHVQPVASAPATPAASAREAVRDSDPAVTSDNRRRTAVIAGALVGVAAIAVVTAVLWGRPAPNAPKPIATDPTDLIEPEPEPPTPVDVTLLDLGIEGTWQLEDESGRPEARVLIERSGRTLRLAGFERSGEREDVGFATIEADILRFDFQMTEMGALVAKLTTPGNWNISWDGAQACRDSEGTMTSSPDLRVWRAHFTCRGASSPPVVLQPTASLSSDGGTIRITIQEDEGKVDTVVLRRESK